MINNLLNKKFLLILFPCFIIIFFIVLILWPRGGLSVKSTFPSPNAKSVGIFTKIYVDFSNSIMETDRNNATFSIKPNIRASGFWSDNNSRFNIKTNSNLDAQTTYAVQINVSKKSYKWHFTTVSLNNISEIDQQKAQEILDNESVAQMEDFYEKYPWYDKIPPGNERYFIGFDPAKNEFFVDLFPLKSSGTPIQDQVNQLKNGVLSELTKIGVDVSQYKILWNVVEK